MTIILSIFGIFISVIVKEKLKVGVMKITLKNSTLRLISLFVLVLFMINLSDAGELYYGSDREKSSEEYADWSLSFYLVAAFGGPIVNSSYRMKTPGMHDHYNFTTQNMLYTLTNFEPKSWIIQLDYRMMRGMGMGMLIGNSVLAKGTVKIGPLADSGEMIGIGNSVKTISLFLTIYLNDYIVLGLGPTYNMTDSPSGYNQIGFLAQMNIRIPLDERFSVNGIVQYRYVGITEIGPYTLSSADEYPSATITTTKNLHPETQIDYSHVFVGIGMSIYFIQK